MIDSVLNSITTHFKSLGIGAYIAESIKVGDEIKILFDGKEYGGIIDNDDSYIYLRKSGISRAIESKGCKSKQVTTFQQRVFLIAHIKERKNLLRFVYRELFMFDIPVGNGIRNAAFVPVENNDDWRTIFEQENSYLPKQVVNVVKITFDIIFAYRSLPQECDVCEC